MDDKKYNKIMEKVAEHLAVRVGVPALNLQLDHESKDGKEKIMRTVDTKDSELFGIFKRIIKSAAIIVRTFESEDGVLLIRPHFTYEHHGGGTNGHDFDFNLKYESGTLSEI